MRNASRMVDPRAPIYVHRTGWVLFTSPEPCENCGTQPACTVCGFESRTWPCPTVIELAKGWGWSDG